MLVNAVGGGVWVKQEDLLASCKEMIKNIDLVFIAACKSDQIGAMLIKEAGVKHVISSQSNQSLIDETTIKFT